MIRSIRWLVATYFIWLLTVSSLVFSQTVVDSQHPDMTRFLDWFSGEFDNNEQVWQQSVDKIAERARHERIYQILKPVVALNIGEHVFFIKQYVVEGDQKNLLRQRLYRLTWDSQQSAIRLVTYRFKDEDKYRYSEQNPDLISTITGNELKEMVGCDIFWTFHKDHYLGRMKDNACVYFSSRAQKKIYVSNLMTLTSSEIWLADEAYDEAGNRLFGHDKPHKNRKVRYFKGWALIKNTLFDANSQDPDAVTFFPNLRLHNEGDQVPLVSKEGIDSGYAIKLSQLTYQNTQVAVLKLGLIDNKTGKTLTYIWSNPDVKRLGMNLRWFQVGLTAEP